MLKMVFANSWQPVFAESGFKSFDDFFDYPDAKRSGKNNKRDVQILTLGNEPNHKVFFLKRFHYVYFKDKLFTLFNFGHFCSQAGCEWKNANILLDNGIETHLPVCYGERTKWGLETKSFLVTEKVQGQCLIDFVTQNWAQLPQPQKEKIIVALAKLIRKIHNAQISLPDLYLWHIFIKRNQTTDELDFAVIDLPRMTHNVADKNRQIRNLGRLDHSMVDKYFDDTLRRLFIESYAGRDWPGGVDKLAAKVKKYSAAVSARRNPKPY